MFGMENTRFLVLGLPLIIFQSAAWSSTEKAGTIVSASGKAWILRPTEERMFAQSGLDFYSGDRIETEEKSQVKLLFTDRTIVDLGPKTKFKVREYLLKAVANRIVDLKTEQGLVRTSVNKKVREPGKFTFRTRGSTMGVRGTEFVVDIPADSGLSATSENVTVLSGAVEVRASAGSASAGESFKVSGGESLSLDTSNAGDAGSRSVAGSASSTTSGTGPAVQTVSSEKMEQMHSDSSFQDKTFSNAVDFGSGTSSGGAGQTGAGQVLGVIGEALASGELAHFGPVNGTLFLPPGALQGDGHSNEHTISDTADITVNFIQ